MSTTTVPFANRRVAVAGTIALYLGAIVAANLLATKYGVKATPYIAFALIGADLTSRDTLQDLWSHTPGRLLRIGLLIAAGGILSYLLNADADKIAIASVVAFTAAATVDTLVYTVLEGRADWNTRVTTSNICAAAVDSVLFLWIAFDVVNEITFAQFCAKVAGGAVWALVLVGWRRR